MARDLYYESANFRESLQKCSRIIEQRLGWSLEQELHRSAQDCQLGRSEEHMEPALTAIQISLFDLLQSYGLRPDAVMGISGGEFAAAYAAGAVSVKYVMDLVCGWALAIREKLGAGGMVMIRAGDAETEALIRSAPKPTYVSAQISPRSAILATGTETVEALLQFLEASGIEHRLLPWQLGYHSPLMDPESLRFSQVADSAVIGEIKVPIYSAASGGLQRTLDARHWQRAVGETAHFATAARTALEDGFDCFLEVNIHPSLSKAIQDQASSMGKEVVVLPVMRSDQPAMSIIQSSLTALSQLDKSVMS
jgi:acyl transferase domain-containing protein